MQDPCLGQTVLEKLANVEEVSEDDAAGLYKHICGDITTSQSALDRLSYRASRHSRNSRAKGEQSARLLSPTGGRGDRRYSQRSAAAAVLAVDPLDADSGSEDEEQAAGLTSGASASAEPEGDFDCGADSLFDSD